MGQQMTALYGLLGYVDNLVIVMESLSFKVSLHITHPERDLSFVESMVGIKPFRVWVAGDQRKTPKGALLDGKYDYSYCCLRLESQSGLNGSDLLSKLLLDLESDFNYWSDFLLSGGTLSLVIFNESEEGRYIDRFDYRLLGRLSKLNISLELDL